MPANLTLKRNSQWLKRVVAEKRAAVRASVEPFTLEDLYPEIEEYSDEEGQFLRYKQIMPHQRLVHTWTSISGKPVTRLLLSGGVGCVGGETIILGRPVCEWVADRQSPTTVSTLYGAARPTRPYIKGRADLYRVRTASGREVVVTAAHRFLSPTGWRPLAHLCIGDVIAADGSWHDRPDYGTARGLTGRYCGGFRPCDELLPPAEVAILDRWRQLHRLVGGDNARSGYDLLSIGDFCHLSGSSPQAVASALHAASIAYERLRDRLGTHEQAEWLTRLLDSGLLLPPSEVDGWQSDRLWECEFLVFGGSRKQYSGEYRVPARQGYASQVADRIRESLSDRSSISYDHYTSFWEEIVDISFCREDIFYDLGVPGPEHYSAEGLWHHNSGKSTTIAAEIFRLVRKYPGIQIVSIIPIDYMFDESWLPVWDRICPEDDGRFVKEYKVKTRTFEFTNGSVYRMRAYDEPDKVRGWEAHVIAIHEAAELCDGNSQKARLLWDALTYRLRAKPDYYPRVILVDQNPKGHNWTWKLWIQNSPFEKKPKVTEVAPGEESRTGYKYKEYEKVSPSGDVFYCISFGTAANKHLPAGTLESMLDNLAQDPQQRQRMIEGDFNPMIGLVYTYPYYSPDWNHVPLEAVLSYYGVEEIPRWWPLWVGIDPAGPRSPWAIEFYVELPEDDRYPNMLLGIGEIYKRGPTWYEIIDDVQEFTRDWRGPIRYAADPYYTPQKQGPSKQSVEGEFKKYGIPVEFPLGHRVAGGTYLVKSLLKPDPKAPHPFLEDSYDEDAETWRVGAPRLMYLKDPIYAFTTVEKETGRILSDNSVATTGGFACYANMKEKEVWRYDEKKLREPKENEEGLSPKAQEKTVDQDDHAQSAEMFVVELWNPFPPTQKSSPRRRDPANGPVVRYGSYKRGRYG